MDAPPQPGTIVRTTARPEAGVTEWTLSNGATVVLKPTTLRADQILFRAFGAREARRSPSDADFRSARVADDACPRRRRRCVQRRSSWRRCSRAKPWA